MATLTLLMPGKIFKKTSAYPIRQHQTFEFLEEYRPLPAFFRLCSLRDLNSRQARIELPKEPLGNSFQALKHDDSGRIEVHGQGRSSRTISLAPLERRFMITSSPKVVKETPTSDEFQ